MAENKEQKLEREYVIPLRREWLRVPRYERTGRAVKAIKKFIARHMKVQDRDFKKIKLDVYLNNEIWFRGRKKPPAKIKVKATKEGDIVTVQFVEEPQYVKFLKVRHEKLHKKLEKKVEKKIEKKSEEKKVEKTEEQKKEESEKRKASAEQKEMQVKQDVKAEKHSTKIDKHKTQPRRMALQK